MVFQSGYISCISDPSQGCLRHGTCNERDLIEKALFELLLILLPMYCFQKLEYSEERERQNQILSIYHWANAETGQKKLALSMELS